MTGEVAPKVMIGDVSVHNVTTARADSVICAWLDGPNDRGRYVCTPNADYVVRAHSDLDFRRAVNGADLRVPDGMWIVYASRVACRPLKASVTGRLLLPRLALHCRDTGRSIGLFGAGPGVAVKAAERLVGSMPGLEIRHAQAPPMGFIVGSPDDLRLTNELAADPPALLFVALGAPKQELWMERHRDEFPTTVMIGVGAAFDVVAGRVREAPAWMTRTGFEWAFRLAQEPRRLVKRYLWDDPWVLWWALNARLGRHWTGSGGSRR